MAAAKAAREAAAHGAGSSASDAARRTADGEQHLIATLLNEGAIPHHAESALPPPVVTTKVVPKKGGERAPEKKPKRGRDCSSSGPVVEDANGLSLSRPAEELWRELGAKAGLELAPRSSSEATSAALAAAIQGCWCCKPRLPGRPPCRRRGARLMPPY
ncbi:unnamed protein product [Cuscuta epithymum]|uniref:Uncharacterized protein n=1 Tax=Cuscuta epithymum TaxID=186058 RepID=A0AAV0FCR9_9ASTE|nr:unnamed protein product [Cuscuta epithymum]